MPELTQLPWGDAMLALARGVVDGQIGIDLNRHRAAVALMGPVRPAADSGHPARDAPGLATLGLTPVFYQLAETLFDIAISVSLARVVAGPAETGPIVATLTPVSADHAGTYGLSVRHAARLRFKIVPCPPPPGEIIARTTSLAPVAKHEGGAG